MERSNEGGPLQKKVGRSSSVALWGEQNNEFHRGHTDLVQATHEAQGPGSVLAPGMGKE